MKRSMLVLALAVAGCGNPVVDQRIDALGPEVTGVPPSEFHRPGQPCVLCHGAYEGDTPQMVVGGTVFAYRGDEKYHTTIATNTQVPNVKVHLYDTTGTHDAVTDCMGNFFVAVSDWNASFPLGVGIECPDPGSNPPTYSRGIKYMKSRISRDGSCASCHYGPVSASSPGWVPCDDGDAMTPQYPIITKEQCPEGYP